MALRSWVGGSGTWDTTSTANWAATSGGVSGASAPTSADNAIFDANSGAVTVTLGEDVPCVQWDIRGFTGTIDFNNYVINVSGSGIVVIRNDAAPASTLLGNPTVNLTYAGGVGTRTIGAGSHNEANAMSINIVAGSDTIAWTTSTIRNFNTTGFSGTMHWEER